MAILYVASEAFELKPFAGMLTGLRRLKWPIDYAFEGILDGRRIMLAANGAGPRLASQAVEVAIRAVTAAELSSSKLEAVVSTGFCGALDPGLREGQIVLANQVFDSNSNETFDCSPLAPNPPFVSGPVITRERIANDATEKQALLARGAIAVDMEAFSVAVRTKRAALPFFCIKVVSDRADESFGFDLNRMRSEDGRIAHGKIILYALKHPNVVPELLRLKQRATSAAKMLGEFLVSCRINTESDRNHLS